MTKSQMNRLGERLRRTAWPDAESLSELQAYRASFDGPMATAQTRLREELGIEATSRLKTVNTIVEKLRREKTRLAEMQDIAGLRVVRDMGLAEQNAMVERIAGLFGGARVMDRRLTPSHFYRAVHVIPVLDGCRIEIQVRTEMQDLWAQGMEQLADVLGRGIRYGEEPRGAAALEAVDDLRTLSPVIAEIEQLRETERQIRAGLPPGAPEPEGLVALHAELEKVSAQLRVILTS